MLMPRILSGLQYLGQTKPCRYRLPVDYPVNDSPSENHKPGSGWHHAALRHHTDW